MIYNRKRSIKSVNAFILMSDRVSKVRSASAVSKVWSRECFIEEYIDNQCKIVIVYNHY